MTDRAAPTPPAVPAVHGYTWPAPSTETHGRTRFSEVFGCVVLLLGGAAVQMFPAIVLGGLASQSGAVIASIVVFLAVVIGGALAVGRIRRRWKRPPAPVGMPGETRGVLRRTVGRHAPLLGMAALGGGIVVSAMVLRGAPLLPIVVFSTADAALVLWATRILWQGGVAVRWLPETLAPGRTATFFVETTSGGSRLTGCQVMLRCVGPCDPGVPKYVCPTRRVVVWSGTHAAEQDPGPEEAVIVGIDVPPGLPATGPCVEWDLIVQGRTMWGLVRESFLVPVGAAPPPLPVAAPG